MAAIVEPIESVFRFAGLDSPLYRLVVVGIAGAAVEFLVKPAYAFDAQGNPRPWAMPMSGEAEPGSTSTPIGFFPLLAGCAAAIFV